VAYATVDELKARLTADGVVPLPNDDACAQFLVQAKTDIDAYCKRDFDKHDGEIVVLEAFQRGDGMMLPASMTPIRTVASITVAGRTLTAPELAKVEIVPNTGLVIGFHVEPGDTVQIECDYGPASTPEKVNESCLRLASRKQRHGVAREKVAEGVSSETIEGYSIHFDPLNIDRDVAALLESHRVKRAAR
jgi:hypothetical protein